MASDSPGYAEKHKKSKSINIPDTGSSRIRGSASLTDKVSFYEQVFKQSSSPSSVSGPGGRVVYGAGAREDSVGRTLERVQVGYHGPRSDARDRSSEDPRRHRIPRASLSPTSSPLTVSGEEDWGRMRSRSHSRSRSRDGRQQYTASPSDDIILPARGSFRSKRSLFNNKNEFRTSTLTRSESFRGESSFSSQLQSSPPKYSSTPMKTEDVLPQRPPRHQKRKSEPHSSLPPTIPKKPSTPYQLWREEHMKQELGIHRNVLSLDTKHLSELEKEIERIQKQHVEEEEEETDDDKSHKDEARSASAGGSVRIKSKDKKKSFTSSVFSMFSRKKKKSSLGAMLKSEGEASILDPSAHNKIIEASDEANNEVPSLSTLTYLNQLRRETPDPDYDSVSYQSSSPGLRRISPRAPRDHDNLSDTSFEDNGRLTPRSNGSEYGRSITQYQPMPNILTGFVRRSSSIKSENSYTRTTRSPSTESFFAKHGASVSVTGSNNQIWYQKYKHSSFSNSHQNTFGEQAAYGAFDGRISKFKGRC